MFTCKQAPSTLHSNVNKPYKFTYSTPNLEVHNGELTSLRGMGGRLFVRSEAYLWICLEMFSVVRDSACWTIFQKSVWDFLSREEYVDIWKLTSGGIAAIQNNPFCIFSHLLKKSNVHIFERLSYTWNHFQWFIDKWFCCGQLWVRHMICGQTCDELYQFTFYLIVLEYPLDSNRSSQP